MEEVYVQRTDSGCVPERKDIRKKDQKMKSSEIVKAFLDLIDDSKTKARWAREGRIEQDKLTQDLLHKLELGGYKDRNKVATKLVRCRRERRRYKDVEEEANTIIDWTLSREGEDVLRKLKHMLGELRQVEKYHENRVYKPRVLKERSK